MRSNRLSTVMPVPGLDPGIVAGIHVFLAGHQQERRGWPRIKSGGDEPGHDSGEMDQYDRNALQRPGNPNSALASLVLPAGAKNIRRARGDARRIGGVEKMVAYLSLPNWKSGFMLLVGFACTFRSGAYGVTKGAYGVTEARTSAGTLDSDEGA